MFQFGNGWELQYPGIGGWSGILSNHEGSYQKTLPFTFLSAPSMQLTILVSQKVKLRLIKDLLLMIDPGVILMWGSVSLRKQNYSTWDHWCPGLWLGLVLVLHRFHRASVKLCQF